MYQAVSAGFTGPRDPVQVHEAHSIDLEAEVVVVTDDVPRHRAAQAAACNPAGRSYGVSLRNLIPAELAKASIPAIQAAFGAEPAYVTPDELGDAWRDNKVHLPPLTHTSTDVVRCRDGEDSSRFRPAGRHTGDAPLSVSAPRRLRHGGQPGLRAASLCQSAAVETLEHGACPRPSCRSATCCASRC